MTTQLAPPPRASHWRAWSLAHGVASLGLLAVFGVGALVSWTETETIVVLTFPVTLTAALVLGAGSWLLAPPRLVLRVGIGVPVLVALAVFVLGSFVALATWWKGFDYVDSPQEPPQRLEAIGDLGYTVGLAGFLAVLVVCVSAAAVAFLARSPRG